MIIHVNESKIIIVLRWIIAGLNIFALAGGIAYLINPTPYLFFGFFIIYILLGKDTNNMIEVFIPEYSVFWGLLMLGVSILIAKLIWRNKSSVFNKITLAAGIIICTFCLVPLAIVPFTIRKDS